MLRWFRLIMSSLHRFTCFTKYPKRGQSPLVNRPDFPKRGQSPLAAVVLAALLFAGIHRPAVAGQGLYDPHACGGEVAADIVTGFAGEGGDISVAAGETAPGGSASATEPASPAGLPEGDGAGSGVLVEEVEGSATVSPEEGGLAGPSAPPDGGSPAGIVADGSGSAEGAGGVDVVSGVEGEGGADAVDGTDDAAAAGSATGGPAVPPGGAGGTTAAANGGDAASIENHLLLLWEEMEQQYLITLRSIVYEYEEEMAALCDRAAGEAGGEEAAERYLAAARSLEENCDGYFYGVLQAGGCSDEAARQMQEFYESTKKLCFDRLAEMVK